MPAPRQVDLTTSTARKRLKARSNAKPYWYPIEQGRALGYRRLEGPGTWSTRYYHGTGKYSEMNLGLADDAMPADGDRVLSFSQALRAAIAWCDGQESGRPPVVEVVPRSYSVAQAMEDYIQWYRLHRKAAWEIEQRIRSTILPQLGHFEVAELSVRHIRLWHQQLVTTPARLRGGQARPILTAEDERKRKNTANRVLTILKAGLNMAVNDGQVDLAVAAAWRIVKPFRGVDQPRIRFFDRAEIDRLLRVCTSDFRRLVTAALLTGCRYGELITAKVEDFRAESRSLHVSGKTGARTLFLTTQGVQFFQAIAAGRRPKEFLLLQDHGRPWKRSEQLRPMAEATKAANIPPPNNFHILRHTYASHFLMNGGDLPGLAQQLGHADTRMTTRHYAHLASQWRLEEVQKAALQIEIDPGNVHPFEARRASGVTR